MAKLNSALRANDYTNAVSLYNEMTDIDKNKADKIFEKAFEKINGNFENKMFDYNDIKDKINPIDELIAQYITPALNSSKFIMKLSAGDNDTVCN